MESENFVFNDCQVCVNARRAVYLEDGRCYICVSVGMSPGGRWAYGYSCMFKMHGCGCPVSLHGAKYGSEDEAVLAGIESAMRYVERHEGKEERVLRSRLEELKAERMFVQLSLF